MAADARTAVGSVLGAVNESALMVTGAVMTASTAVSMVNRFVTKAAQQQIERDALEMSDFRKKLIETQALETTRRRMEIDQWISADPSRQGKFDEAYERYTKVLEDLDKQKAGA